MLKTVQQNLINEIDNEISKLEEKNVNLENASAYLYLWTIKNDIKHQIEVRQKEEVKTEEEKGEDK